MFEDVTDGTANDVQEILGLFLGFAESMKPHTLDLRTGSLFGVVAGMRIDFPHPGGLDAASPFKKAANFIVHWHGACPIEAPTIPHANVLFAFAVAATYLHGAELHGNSTHGPRTLSNPIEVSAHSLRDILDALDGTTPDTSFKLVSVLLEQMAYKTNPDCQYETRPITGFL